MNFMQIDLEKVKIEQGRKISLGGSLALFYVNQREFPNVRF